MVELNSLNPQCTSNGNIEHIGSKKSRNFIKENLLLITTLAGVGCGTLIGILLRSYHLSSDTIMLIAYPGELFLRMLKLITMPMLISSLVTVTANLNARINGKIVFRTLIYFACTSMLSAFCGICIAMFFQPGNVSASNDASPGNQKSQFLDSMLDLGRNLLPDNIFEATFRQTVTIYVPSKDNSTLIRELTQRSGTNTMGIVVFCLVFGSLLSTMGERGQVVKDFFRTIFEVTLKIITKIIWLTSVAVASIIAAKILSIENLMEVFSQLASFIFCVLFGLTIHQLVILPAIYFIVLRKQPYAFFVKLIDPWITAFAASSSSVTLPTTLRCMNDKMKLDSRISTLVLTLGVNLNTSGGAMFLAIASIFLARLDGAVLSYGALFTILLMVTISSMSMPSVPSSSLVMLLVILTTINVDAGNISLLFAVDWLLDRCRTTSNVMGHCFAAVVLERISRKDLMKMDVVTQQQKSENETIQSV